LIDWLIDLSHVEELCRTRSSEPSFLA